MPRLRILVGTLAGVAFAFFVGLVPPEILSWLREWSGRSGPDPEGTGDAPVGGKRRRGGQRKRR